MPRLTPNRRAFEREQKRLQRIISTEQKRVKFLDIDTNVVPKMPVIVTKKKLQAIQRLTRSDILSTAKHFNLDTGQWEQYQVAKSRPRNPASIKPLKSEREIRKIRHQAAKKAAETRAYHRTLEYKQEMQNQYRHSITAEYGITDEDLTSSAEYYIREWAEGEISETELKDAFTHLMNEQLIRNWQLNVGQTDEDFEDEELQKELDEYEQSLEDSVREVEEPEPEPFEEHDEEDYTEEYDDFEEPSLEDYDVPAFSTQVIEYIRAQADMAENINIATLIRDILNKQIEIEGYEEVANRIADSNEDLITMFETVMYDSDLQEVFQNAEAIVDTITGDGFSFMNDLHFAIMEDADNNYYKGGFK